MSLLNRFKRPYFIAGIFLLMIEIIIARYVDDAIVRPYVGDLLVVVLLYCLIRFACTFSVIRSVLIVLCFAYTVELMQYYGILRKLALQDSELASIVIGNSFDWLDILMYTMGIVIVLLIERLRKKL